MLLSRLVNLLTSSVNVIINLFTVLSASNVSYNASAAADSNGNSYPVPKTVLSSDGTSYGV